MPAVRRVYVASEYVPNLVTKLRKALEDAGFGDTVTVEELKFQGTFESSIDLPEETVQKIPDIEYLLADPLILHHIFKHPKSNLVWAQNTSAGVDFFFKNLEKAQKTPNFIYTRHFTCFGQQIAEYVVGRIVFRERQFGRVHDLQKEKKFFLMDPDLCLFRTLDQINIGIIGFGEIGQKVAEFCRAMGMTVWAAVRDERYSTQKDHVQFPHTDHVRPMSRLNEVLESCDYVVSALPSTPGTVNLLSGDVLKPCQKKKSVLISVGRGDVIDDDSLISAIRNDWLGGAILDVFNKEPLPPSSELWTLPGVTITPHNSGTVISGKTQSPGSFVHNLRCYMEGKPMRAVVDFNKGY